MIKAASKNWAIQESETKTSITEQGSVLHIIVHQVMAGKFTVCMNEGEKYQIEEWVKQYPRIETGGDLFGAWIDDRTAVVQFVLGPGKDCRRTSVSFYQSIEYLRNAGGYLTKHHGLCNIGQWHSHHQLGLKRPSGGDENTVWGNMPSLGLNRYIVIIATISDNSRFNRYDSSFHSKQITVEMNPYLFEIKQGRQSGVMDGFFISVTNNSPFRCDKCILQKVKDGAETTIAVKRYRKRSASSKHSETEKVKKTKQETQSQEHDSKSCNIWSKSLYFKE